MSWLNLKRLLPKKVWKVITNKIQTKLHKLNRSKAIKKHKIGYRKTSKKLGWPSLSKKPKKFKIKPITHTLINHRIPKRLPPVYVDQLFIEPVYVKKEQLQIQEDATCSSSKSDHKKKCLSKTREAEKQILNKDTADDMWESLVLGSPQQMQGIDERADEFIARFRAQMQHQEIHASRL